MPDVHLIPGLWKIDGYSGVRRTILEHFAVEEGHNYIEFPYDWRRTNRASARKLKRVAEAALDRWRKKSGNPDARLILIAHSMGGLVSRWYLEKLGGWERTRSLVSLGTPYRGAINAVESLHFGMRKKAGPFELVNLTAALRSFRSVYELLPVYRCVDIGGDKLVALTEASIPGIDPERVSDAARFHEDIRTAVEKQKNAPDRYKLHPVTGIEQPTSQSVRVTARGVEILRSLAGENVGGDGTVPRVSAVPAEITDGMFGTFAVEQHGSLQNASAVLEHLRGVLSGAAIVFPEGPQVPVGVDVDELFSVKEPIRVAAFAAAEGITLTARITNVDTAETLPQVALRSAGDGTYQAEVPPQPEGCYRVTVEGGTAPVTALVTVVG